MKFSPLRAARYACFVVGGVVLVALGSALMYFFGRAAALAAEPLPYDDNDLGTNVDGDEA
jgi:hypothetical protein